MRLADTIAKEQAQGGRFEAPAPKYLGSGSVAAARSRTRFLRPSGARDRGDERVHGLREAMRPRRFTRGYCLAPRFGSDAHFRWGDDAALHRERCWTLRSSEGGGSRQNSLGLPAPTGAMTPHFTVELDFGGTDEANGYGHGLGPLKG